MRVPLSWLKTLVATDLSVDELAEKLTVAGIEVEEIERSGEEAYLTLSILANIARCQSMHGVAKEVAAITECVYVGAPQYANLEAFPQTLHPRIETPTSCRRFSAALIDGVVIEDSPLWLQQKLLAVGVTPINNLVDLSNYVMFEIGQPTHAYDADRLANAEIAVRLSKENETLHTLAQTEEQSPLTLPKGVPIIVCQDKPVAIAGVVGGRSTAIGLETNKILLESASFDYIAIRRAQAACKTFTDASIRFSRGVDPALTTKAIARFCELLKAICPQAKVVALGDTLTVPIQDRRVDIELERINSSLGTLFSAQEVMAILGRVGIASQLIEEGTIIRATITSEREDITRDCDLLEEIARLHGYDKLPETMPIEPIPAHPRNVLYESRESIRDHLVQLGLQEVMSYSMSAPATEAKLVAGQAQQSKTPAYVQLRNPVSDEKSILRRTLLPGLLEHVAFNSRYQTSCQIFEIGRVFLPEIPAKYSAALPSEPERLAGVLTGKIQSGTIHEATVRRVDFYDAKQIVLDLFKRCHCLTPEFVAVEQPPFRPGQCANIVVNGESWGMVGTLHELVVEAFGIPAQGVVGFDLDLDKLMAQFSRDYKVVPPPRFPSIKLDISMVLNEDIPAGKLLATTRELGGELLQGIEVFDVYRSEQLGADKKALALRLELNGQTQTLTMEEAVLLRQKIVAGLEEKFKASLRGGM